MFNNNKYYQDKKSIKNNKYFVLIILLLQILLFSFIYSTNKQNIDIFLEDVHQWFSSKLSDEISDISDKEPKITNIIDHRKHYTEEYYTAYHEAGHTLISLYLSSKYNNDCQFIQADIIPENKALGKTYTSYSSNKPLLKVLVSLGGAAAELILKDDKKIPSYKVGEGCGSDLSSIKKTLLENKYSLSDIDYFIQKTIRKVKLILNKNKKYLQYIADLLLSRKKITYKDLRHIVPFINKN